MWVCPFQAFITKKPFKYLAKNSMFVLCSRRVLGLQLRKCNCMIHRITIETVLVMSFSTKGSSQ